MRAWFDAELITEAGTRGLVHQDESETVGLPNAVVRALQKRFLVRSEARGGDTWIELVHDRFVEPIRANNAAWFAGHLSALQRQAALWNEQGRSDGLLLSGEALAEAEAWAAQQTEPLEAVEQEFLGACRRAQAVVERERRQSRLIRILGIAALAVAVLAFVAAGFALSSNQQAQIEKRRADGLAALALTREAEAVAALATAEASPADAERQKRAAQERQQIADNQRELADKNAAEAEQEKLRADAQARRVLAENLAGQSQLLIRADKQPGDLALILARDAVLTDLTVNTDRALRFALSTAPRQQTFPPVARRHQGAVHSVAFSPDGQWIVSGGADGTIRLWRAADLEPQKLLFGHAGWVLSVGFSPDGRQIVSGGEDGTVRLWDVASGAEAAQLAGHGCEQFGNCGVWSVGFSPDGRQIVSGGENGTVRLWDAPEQVLLEAIDRISRPAPLLTTAERRRFGVGADVELLDQSVLKPLMARARALALVEQGQTLARAGAIPAAVEALQGALKLDPTLAIEPQALAQRILDIQEQALRFASSKLAAG